ncbi:GntR family phosphonate transport system transcriptional regulator [Hoeflea marina]|uniref:GntR family phosphonate transport system transcriptional regulator n=1 Tax=Hoeflea marina TaxID=274592 RepID=A0A317PLF9_9HYPH|nr:phosphonate metabolism transcriptional regulator PhnF [Hoeflea marina]PWV98893.1 GntR family phosphonate transport system transcriptional regulator [Hoeflea marina]
MTVPLQRRSGIALWRQVADGIRQTLLPHLTPGDQLPPETALAGRFGVNRHTVRAAVAALEKEGILRAEQGRGTFLASRRRLRYPIGRRTRFSEGLGDQTLIRRGRLLDAGVEPAGPDVARALCLEAGAPVERLETVSSADDVAVSRAISWFDAKRFGGIAARYGDTGSITRALAAFGVPDYTRKTTMITAVHAEADDLQHLSLSPGAIILLTRSINIDPDAIPIQYAETRFAADRMEFLIGDDAGMP